MVSAVGTLELGVKFCSLHTFKSVSYGTAHLRQVMFALFELFAWIHAFPLHETQTVLFLKIT